MPHVKCSDCDIEWTKIDRTVPDEEGTVVGDCIKSGCDGDAVVQG